MMTLNKHKSIDYRTPIIYISPASAYSQQNSSFDFKSVMALGTKQRTPLSVHLPDTSSFHLSVTGYRANNSVLQAIEPLAQRGPTRPRLGANHRLRVGSADCCSTITAAGKDAREDASSASVTRSPNDWFFASSSSFTCAHFGFTSTEYRCSSRSCSTSPS